MFNFSKAFLELKYKFSGVTFMSCIDLRILKAVLGIVHRPFMKVRLFLSYSQINLLYPYIFNYLNHVASKLDKTH